MRILRLAAMLSCAVVLTARAQGVVPLGSSENEQRTGRIIPMIGAHWDHATGPSLHLAVIRTDLESSESYGGWLVSAEGGLRGGKFGIGRGGGPTAAFGGMLRVAWMRTWGTGGPLAPDQNFLGFDLRLTVRDLSASRGEYWRVRGNAPDDGHLFDFSFGFGF